jgi:hypothetical protein
MLLHSGTAADDEPDVMLLHSGTAADDEPDVMLLHSGTTADDEAESGTARLTLHQGMTQMGIHSIPI